MGTVSVCGEDLASVAQWEGHGMPAVRVSFDPLLVGKLCSRGQIHLCSSPRLF